MTTAAAKGGMAARWLLAVATSMVLATCLLLALTPAGATARAAVQPEPREVTLEVVPGKIELTSGVEDRVEVVVRNPTTATLHAVRLQWLTNLPVAVGQEVIVGGTPQASKVSPSEVSAVGAGSAHAWTFRISPTDQQPISGTIFFRAQYTFRPGNGGAQAEQIVYGELKVQRRALESIGDVVRVEVSTTLTYLDQYHPGKIYLMIENTSDRELRVVSVAPDGPVGLVFTPTAMTTVIPIKPREIEPISFMVGVPGSVQPGEYLLLFNTKLAWGDPEVEQTGSIVVTHEVNIGVFGEADILELFDIPSFFILPGFLIVTIWGLLWGWAKLPKEDSPFQPKAPTFWVVGIFFSLLLPLAYPYITCWLGQFPALRQINVVCRDYVRSHDFTDLALVWTISLTFAVSVAVILASITWLVHYIKRERAAYEEWKLEQLTPTEEDGPIEVLRKIGKRKLGIRLSWALLKLRPLKLRQAVFRVLKSTLWRSPEVVLQQVAHTTAGVPDSPIAFSLGPAPGDVAKTWLVTFIVVTWPPEPNSELQGWVQSQYDRGGSATLLADLLDKAYREEKITNVDWLRQEEDGDDDRPYIRKPKLVDRAATQPTGTPMSILREV